MQPVSRLASLALTILFVACGHDGGQAVSETGRLVVEKSLADGPIYTEGSSTHVRIVRDDGATIVDGVKTIETLSTPLLDEALRPGTYTVETVERPCQGNCDHLDAPAETTRCTLDVDVKIGETTTVSIVLARAGSEPAASCAAS